MILRYNRTSWPCAPWDGFRRRAGAGFACLTLASFSLLPVSAQFVHHSVTFDSDFANQGLIPDNDATGWSDTRTVSLPAAQTAIHQVQVTLDISSGWSGDLVVYLRHETVGGTGFAVLVNRVGKTATSDWGYGDAGFGSLASSTFRLSDSADFDVHNYQSHAPVYNALGQLTGTWKPDGSSFISFRNLDANGTWTLFAADLAGGDVSSVRSWGLEVTTVPEPETILPALLLLTWAAGRLRGGRGAGGRGDRHPEPGRG